MKLLHLDDIKLVHLFQSEYINVADVIARTFRILVVWRMLKMTASIVPRLVDARQSTNPQSSILHYSRIPWTQISRNQYFSLVK